MIPKGFVGWADDTITKMGVHSTTHIDAPWHYDPTSETDEGVEKVQTVEEMPLEKGIGAGVMINMTHRQEGEVITKDHLIQALAKTGAEISGGTTVLIHTERDKYVGTKEFWKKGSVRKPKQSHGS